VTPRTLTPTSKPVTPVIPTPTPTLHPSVTLATLEKDTVDCGAPVTLRWSWPHGLETDECYQLRLWEAEHASALFSLTTTQEWFDLSTSDFPPGTYNWGVVVVNSITDEPVSKESKSLHFHIVLPTPVVRSISLDSTTQGRSVQVDVNGESFTPSLIIIIGVPLQTTFVDSGTITATIPTTLAAGQYPVIVQDPVGGTSISSTISFTVQALTPPPTVRPPYPPPVLGWGGIIHCNVTFRWQWTGTLAKDEWFAVRVGKDPNPPRAQTWTQELQYTYVLTESGKYAWQIAICQGKPEDAHCSSLDGTELVASEYGFFEFGGCATKETPKPKPKPAP